MIITIGADELEMRIRDRTEVGGGSFTPSHILDTMRSVLNLLYTDMRLTNQMHETDTLAITISDLKAVEGRSFVYDYTLPETVGEVVLIEGLVGGGRYTNRFRNLGPKLAPNSVGAPSWQWLDGRPGKVRLFGFPNRYSGILLTVVRTWAPMHYGTADDGGAQTLTFSASPTAGRLVRRDSVYEGMNVLLTNDNPSGALDQMRRIESFVGATRVATMTEPWDVAPTSSTTYSLVPQLSGEYEELLIEESAQILKQELSEAFPPSDYLMRLRSQFQDGMARRDDEPANRIIH